MKKKILLASLFLGVLFFCSCPPPPEFWKDNIVSTTCPNFAEKSVAPKYSDIYIDASGSMKPYFIADNRMVTNAVSELKNLNTKSTDIYFLGTPEPYTGLVERILSSVRKQPNLSATTFHKYFEDVANEIDTVKNKISYLVTDGIISVYGIDTKNALVEMQGKIKAALEGHSNLAGAIFRYEGGYKGPYWNCKNQRINLQGEQKRPFYIIALGTKESMRWLNQQNLEYTSAKLFMGIHDVASHNKIEYDEGKDSVKIEKFNEPITCRFQYPSCLKDIDVSNAVITVNGEKESRITCKKDESNIELYINNVALPTGLVSVGLKVPNQSIDNWTKVWNCDDDLQGPDETSTFGLKTLVQGMYDALETDKNILDIEFKFINN